MVDRYDGTRSANWVVRCLVAIPVTLAIAVLVAWAATAICYSNLPWPLLRTSVAVTFVLGTVAAYLLFPRRGRTTLWFFAVFGLVVVWWSSISPSQDRDWALDVAELAHATIDGDRVTIRNVRNFDYRSETDFTVAYDERTYDLRELEHVDLSLCYWDGNRKIAHTLISFGFTGGEWLALSIETRKEKSEVYSAIAGFFKQYELIYIIADERDLFRLRTNYRDEEMYLYPVKCSQAQARTFFMNMVDTANRLSAIPEWYNALDNNCTTALIPLEHGARSTPFEFDMRMLLNGYLDEMGYERGFIPADVTDGMPFPQMREEHRVSDFARRYDTDPDFSNKIRSHLPRRVE